MADRERNELGQYVGMVYTEELGQRICAEISDGSSLRSICKLEWAPDKKTVWNWMQRNKEFKELYEVACRERAHGYAEDIVEISDDGTNDWMENNDPANPGYRFNGEHFGRSRLRVDTRKWICAKMLPKLYGDKVDLTHANPDGSPIRLLING